MAAIDRGIELSSWSDDLRDVIRRRISESGGVALITLSALIAVALATWSVQDPSLSHATDGPVRNLLGTPGAIGADLLMQLFGLAATVLVLPVAVWGWRIATHRPFDREWMRLAFWLGRHDLRARASRPACRRARTGRCRPDSAASSATPCCACPSWCSDRSAGTVS